MKYLINLNKLKIYGNDFNFYICTITFCRHFETFVSTEMSRPNMISKVMKKLNNLLQIKYLQSTISLNDI